jgi:anaerobic magnesium-protoporphyrin IX monomethyl ester cyclase
MKIVFAAMGEDNLSTESLSAALKQAGHETALAFDPSLFDEGMSYRIASLARLFSQRTKVVQKIVRLNPDLVAISVFSDNYRWACAVAEGVKRHLPVPIIFGGVFATNCPETVIANPHVDMVCIGEGEQPIVELVGSMAKGTIDESIKNLWFKKNGEVIKNPVRPLQDLDALPAFDKSIFENDITVRNRYYTLASRGCMFACSYCSQSFYAQFNNGKDHRRKSVDLIIEELRQAKGKYHFRLVDFEDSVLFANKAWFREFALRYKTEIDVPYICMGHPLAMDDEIAALLASSGCYRVQIGIQSMDEKNRKALLHRPETNEQVRRCCRALDKYKVRYAIDHIFGLPNERDEQHLFEAAWEYSQFSSLHKIDCFFLTCYPKTPMIRYAIQHGMIKAEDEQQINAGAQGSFFYDYGITTDKALRRLFKAYVIFFRIIPILPKRVKEWMLRHKMVRVFWIFPKIPTLLCIDLFLAFKNRDPVSRHWLEHYSRWFRRILLQGGVK